MMASKVRFARSAMLEILGADYIRTAYAKGLKEKIVIGKHALRNASIPIVSVIGLQVAGFVGAVVLVEVVFSLRGIGEVTVNAAITSNYPLHQFDFPQYLVLHSQQYLQAIEPVLGYRKFPHLLQ